MNARNPAPPGPLARLLGALAAVALGLLGVFLFTAFLAVAGVLALVGLARLWWLRRNLQGRERSTVFEADYRVSEDQDEVRTPDAILPPDARGR